MSDISSTSDNSRNVSQAAGQVGTAAGSFDVSVSGGNYNSSSGNAGHSSLGTTPFQSEIGSSTGNFVSVQGVVLVDSFTVKFRPVTLQTPKVLLPLAGFEHMLDMNLEWLSSSGIVELILLTCAHTNQIKRYVYGDDKAFSSSEGLNVVEAQTVNDKSEKNDLLLSRRKRLFDPLKKFKKVTIIECNDCLSAGDALRQLDRQNVIRNDFLLVQGDVVSNMKLDTVLQQHRTRRLKDKQCICTVVMRSVGAMQRQCRLGDAELSVAIDKKDNRLLYYAENVSDVNLDRESCIDGRSYIEIRHDLQDCDVLICAPETLYVFRENFDYQRIRQDFICGILSDETLGNKIHVHEIVNGEYASRVHNLRSYDAISRDIIMRWTYPFVPDVINVSLIHPEAGSNNLNNNNSYDSYSDDFGMKLLPHYVYKDCNVTVPISSNLGPCSLVNAGTRIGDNVIINTSIIGFDCKIGNNVVIEDSYVHSDVVIGDNCIVRGAMLFDKCHLHQNTIINQGCVLSYNVVVGPHVELPILSKISLCNKTNFDDYESGSEELESYGDGNGLSGANGVSVISKEVLDAAKIRAKFGSNSFNEKGNIEIPLTEIDESNLENENENEETENDCKDGSQSNKIDIKRQESHLDGDLEGICFDTGVVGVSGAGWLWFESNDIDDENIYEDETVLDELVPVPADWWISRTAEDLSDAAYMNKGKTIKSANAGDEEDDEDSDDDMGEVDSALMAAERHFKKEVTETFLRCVLERFDERNVVQELNALKLAENRCFADIARYMFISLLDLSLPPPAECLPENRILYSSSWLSLTKAESIVKPLSDRLETWRTLLMKYLRNQDDQIELLQTFEEYCLGDGVFKQQQQKQKARKKFQKNENHSNSINIEIGESPYAPLFMKVLMLLYNHDILSEEAILQWAEERTHATGDDRRFMEQSQKFIEWLKTASEEESDDDDDDDDNNDNDTGDSSTEDEGVD